MKTHTWILASVAVLLAVVLWTPQSAQAQVSFGYTGPYTSFYAGPTPYYSYYAPAPYSYVRREPPTTKRRRWWCHGRTTIDPTFTDGHFVGIGRSRRAMQSTFGWIGSGS